MNKNVLYLQWYLYTTWYCDTFADIVSLGIFWYRED